MPPISLLAKQRGQNISKYLHVRHFLIIYHVLELMGATPLPSYISSGNWLSEGSGTNFTRPVADEAKPSEVYSIGFICDREQLEYNRG